MKKTVFIRCELQQMAQSDVLDMIPADTVSRIRAKDPHPEFRVFSVGHEGDANANIVGKGMSVLRYARNIIVQMFNNVKLGLDTFYRHDPRTNSHEGRQRVGEVVGKTLKEIGGRLHTLVAVHIDPAYEGPELDIASIEGNFEAEEREDGTMGVVDLSSVTGLALSNHEIDVPGMPGATLQAALQMFTPEKGRSTMGLKKEEIIAAIRELNLKPTDVFEDGVILSSEVVKSAKQEEYEHAKRLEKKLGEAREENTQLQKKVTDAEAKASTLAERANASAAKDTLRSIATEKKLDPKFVTFLDKNLKGFKSTKEGDEFKAELEKFVDAQGKEYVELGKLYGTEAKLTTEAAQKKEGGEGNPAGTPSGDGAGSGDGKDLTDPKNNDMIPA